MLLPTVIIICLGFIIWQKMDELSGKIELLALSNRTESEITASNTEETVNKELDNIIGEETIGEKDNDLEQETSDTVGEVGTEEAEIEEIGTEEGGDVEEAHQVIACTSKLYFIDSSRRNILFLNRKFNYGSFSCRYFIVVYYEPITFNRNVIYVLVIINQNAYIFSGNIFNGKNQLQTIRLIAYITRHF